MKQMIQRTAYYQWVSKIYKKINENRSQGDEDEDTQNRNQERVENVKWDEKRPQTEEINKIIYKRQSIHDAVVKHRKLVKK